jgi:DNA polymerase-1
VRSALGRSVREAFVAKEGYKLISIDYSQIELRLLAHFSKDAALMDAFNKGVDIHLATAVKLFGEEEAQEKRNLARNLTRRSQRDHKELFCIISYCEKFS